MTKYIVPLILKQKDFHKIALLRGKLIISSIYPFLLYINKKEMGLLLFFTLASDRKINGQSETAEEYYKQLLNYCLYCLHCDKVTAEECTQEVYAAYYASTLRKTIPAPKAWLFRTADNFLNRYIRQLAIEKRRTVSFDEDKYEESGNSVLIYEQDLEVVLEENVNVDKHAERIISALSDKDQRLYTQYFKNHTPIKELATEYNVSEGTMRGRIYYVKQHILRNIDKLRERGEFESN
jgi:RNA polymerase sigma factor (sigma-70 family)